MQRDGCKLRCDGCVASIDLIWLKSFEQNPSQPSLPGAISSRNLYGIKCDG